MSTQERKRMNIFRKITSYRESMIIIIFLLLCAVTTIVNPASTP